MTIDIKIYTIHLVSITILIKTPEKQLKNLSGGSKNKAIAQIS